jgi:hypothetical protein
MCNMGIRERGRYFNVNGMTPSVSDCDRPWYMYFNLNSICLLPNVLVVQAQPRDYIYLGMCVCVVKAELYNLADNRSRMVLVVGIMHV